MCIDLYKTGVDGEGRELTFGLSIQRKEVLGDEIVRGYLGDERLSDYQDVVVRVGALADQWKWRCINDYNDTGRRMCVDGCQLSSEISYRTLPFIADYSSSKCLLRI